MNKIEEKKAPRFGEIQCPVCGTVHHDEPVITVPTLDSDLEYMRCGVCDVIFVHNLEFPDYSQTGDFVMNDAETAADGVKSWPLLHYLDVGAGLHYILSIGAALKENGYVDAAPEKTFLEIGAGFGFLSGFASHVLEMDVEAYEPGGYGEIGSRLLGIHTNKSYFTETDKKFAFITAGEVIEHLKDPKAFVENIYKALADDGVAYMTTPDAGVISDALPADAEGDIPAPHILAPGQHYTLFTIRAFEHLLTNAGIQNHHVFSNGFQIHGIFSPSKQIDLTLFQMPSEKTTRTYTLNYLYYLERRFKDPETAAALPVPPSVASKISARFLLGVVYRIIDHHIKDNNYPAVGFRLDAYHHQYCEAFGTPPFDAVINAALDLNPTYTAGAVFSQFEFQKLSFNVFLYILHFGEYCIHEDINPPDNYLAALAATLNILDGIFALKENDPEITAHLIVVHHSYLRFYLVKAAVLFKYGYKKEAAKELAVLLKKMNAGRMPFDTALYEQAKSLQQTINASNPNQILKLFRRFFSR